MKMRQYMDSDLECIIALANKAWRDIRKMAREELGDAIADVLNPQGDAISKGEQVRASALKSPENFLVCEEAGKVVGFISFSLDKQSGVGEIGNNAADAESGLKGIGQTMYRAVLEHFKANGIKVACVTTGLDPAHARARKAYERAGFSKSLPSVRYYMDLAEYPVDQVK